MLESLEILGYWWLPENSKTMFPGTLKFSQEEGGQLELLGLFTGIEAIKQPRNSSIILGFSTDGKPITLYRCHLININIKSPGINTSVYQCHTIFLGVHFQSEKDITFKSLSVNYTNLNEWVGLGEFETERRGQDFHIHYHRPDPIAFLVNEKLQLSVVFTSRINTTKFGIELTGKQMVFFKLEARDGEEDFDFLQQNLSLLRRLLILAVGRLVHSVRIIGYTEKNRREEGAPLYSTEVDIYYQLIETPRNLQLLPDSHMLFTFRDIQSRFEYLIQKWFLSVEELKAVHDLYFGSLYSQRLFISHKFLNIIQGLETYHRLRINNQVLPKEKHNQRVEEILAVVPEQYRTWIEGLLRTANQPSLRIRLSELVSNFNNSIVNMVSDTESFVASIVATRNHLTHHTRDKKAITDPLKLYDATRILAVLMEAVLLSELGFTMDEVVELQKKRQNYPI